MIKDYRITSDIYMSSSTIYDIEFAGKQISDNNHEANISNDFSYLYLQMSQTYSTLSRLLTPM